MDAPHSVPNNLGAPVSWVYVHGRPGYPWLCNKLQKHCSRKHYAPKFGGSGILIGLGAGDGLSLQWLGPQLGDLKPAGWNHLGALLAHLAGDWLLAETSAATTAFMWLPQVAWWSCKHRGWVPRAGDLREREPRKGLLASETQTQQS